MPRLQPLRELRSVTELFHHRDRKASGTTVLATELPETVPSRALVMTATLAGRPKPSRNGIREINKQFSDPCFLEKRTKEDKEEDKVAETPRGIPRMPSVVNTYGTRFG